MGAAFNQHFEHVHGDVYNVAGDLILSKSGTRDDFASAVRGLKQELAALEGIPDADRAELADELEQAAAEAQAVQPQPDRIRSTLDRVKDRLESLDGVAAGALALAGTVGRIVAWTHGFPG